MPEYLAPGVFVEEIDSGSKPIEGVGINTAAFIGYAKSGDFNKPTFVTNWTQFCQQFGEEENAITLGLCKELGLSVSDVRAAKKAARKGWMEFANAAVSKSVAAGTATVKSFQEFLRKYDIPQGGLPYLEGTYLAHAIRGYYDNGGGRAYVIRVARPEDITALTYAGDGVKGEIATKTPATPAKLSVGPLLLTAKEAGVAGNDIKVEVEHVGDNDGFILKINQGTAPQETFGTKDKPLTADTAPGAVKSKLVAIERLQSTMVRPEPKPFQLIEGADAINLAAKGGTTALAASPLSNGLANLRPDDFIGDEAQRTGLGSLAPLEGVNFIAIPDLMAGLFQREEASAAAGANAVGPEVLSIDDKKRQAILDIQCSLVGLCERAGNRMAILDPIPGLTPMEMNEITMGTAYNSDNGQGTIYYPWIKIADPMRKGQQLFVPPSGHIAGVWARVGTTRGVHKAPANEGLIGAVALEVDITKGEQELLNPNGINCIRSFPGMGIRVWGARTLATVGNPSWKYVNVRRLFNYLKDSLNRGMQWVVFEPNDQDLWGRVRRNISAFLYTEWMEGKLFGTTPGEAYYVKCDDETNPQEMIDLGRLYVEIGINPVKPAEFVILRLGQWSSGGASSEE